MRHSPATSHPFHNPPVAHDGGVSGVGIVDGGRGGDPRRWTALGLRVGVVRALALAALPVLALGLVGCGDPGPASVEVVGGHRHESIHGGVAVELGEHQYQLDVVADAATGVVKAWVMDGHMENFVRLPLKSFELVAVTGQSTQRVTLQAQANVSTGETVGETSFFQGESAGLKGWKSFSGQLPELDVRGTVFRNVRFEYSKHP